MNCRRSRSAIVLCSVPARGGHYRIAFITTNATAATSSDINYYNDFVTRAAEAVPGLAALNTTWTAIVSTPTINAEDNTGTNPSVSAGYPIYDTRGFEFVPNNNVLWSGNVQHFIESKEDGTRSGNIVPVWTGSTPQGTGYAGLELGASGNSAIEGMLAIYIPGNSDWIQFITNYETAQLPVYGVSDVLTALAGDVNHDGIVNSQDIAFVSSN